MRFLERRIPPVAVTLLFAGVMAALSVAVPATVSIPGRSVLAMVLAAVGLGIALAGVRDFRRHQTTTNPMTPEHASALVVTGIYRYSRNPMYLGFLLVLAGWGVYLAHGVALLLLPLYVWYLTRFQILPKERALERRFGQAFRNYTRSVRRWV